MNLNNFEGDPFWLVNCPVLRKTDWNKLKKGSPAFSVLHDKLLVPLMTDEEKKAGNWTRTFEPIRSFYSTSVQKITPKPIILEEGDFHIITETEFNDIKFTIYAAATSNSLKFYANLKYWIYALTRLHASYSNGFYSQLLTYLSQLLDSIKHGQGTQANEYFQFLFSEVFQAVIHINDRENECGRSLNDEQFFPGISPLLCFLEKCIPILEKVSDTIFIDFDEYIKGIYSSVNIALSIKFLENLERHEIFRKNFTSIEHLLANHRFSEYLNLIHYCLDELKFSVVIFQAIEKYWNEWRKEKEIQIKEDALTKMTKSTLTNVVQIFSKQRNSYSDYSSSFYYCTDDLKLSVTILQAIEYCWNRWRKGKEEGLKNKFNEVLRWRLSITPVLPYLLMNSFPDILPQPISIDPKNELFQMMVKLNQLPLPQRKRLEEYERPERHMVEMASRLTRERGRDYRVDENIILQSANMPTKPDHMWFPYNYCSDKMRLYAQKHYIPIYPCQFAFYESGEAVELLWKHSETNSNWFYYIFFDALVPKEDEPNFQQGELLYTLLIFLCGRTDVREKFPKHKKKTFDYFCKTVDSMMEFGSLLVYYMRLKEFMPEYSEKMAERIRQRLNAERLFFDFVTSPKELEITGKLKAATKKFPFVFFYSFMKSFMVYTYHENKGDQIQCLQRFADALEYLLDLKQIWMTGKVNDDGTPTFGTKPLREVVHYTLIDTKKRVPTDEIEIICGDDWDKVMTSPSLKKLRFDNFKYSTLTILNLIAKGGQAKAYRVKCPKLVFPVVAKMWPKDKFNIQLVEEIRTLLTVQSNPHIVTIHGYIVEGIQTRGILMEYCEGGSLKEVIKSSKIYTQADMLFWTTQAACGLNFLHSNGIVHRDVNPANMLLDAKHQHLKISDLGIAKISIVSKFTATSFQLTEYRGTRGFIAPEIRDGNVNKYTAKVDVFSLGRSMWNMVYRSAPTDLLVKESLETFPKSLPNVKSQKLEVSDYVWKFIIRMISQLSNDRPSMEEALKIFGTKIQFRRKSF